MKNYYYTSTIFLLIFFSCNSDLKNSEEHYSKAKNYFENKDYSNSLKEVDLSIQLDSSNFKSYKLKAKIKDSTNLEEDAIQVYKILLDKNYELDSINFEIGLIFFSLGLKNEISVEDSSIQSKYYNSAIIYFIESIKNNPLLFRAYEAKIKTLHNAQRYKEALETVNTTNKMFPDSISLILYKGIEKYCLEDYKSALIDLNRFIEKNTDSFYLSNAYRFRGLAYERLDSLSKALSDFNKALEYDKDDFMSLSNRGNIYILLNQKEKACNDFRKAADLGYIAIYDEIKKYCGK